MKILLTGISALELWDRGVARHATPTNICSLGCFNRRPSDLFGLLPGSFGISAPGHVLSGTPAPRVHNQKWHTHLWGRKLPAGSIFQLSDSAFICSPEFCFLQLSSVAGLYETMLLGCELCGTYSTLVPAGSEYRQRPALTSIQALSGYVNEASADKSQRYAVRALPFIADGCASPLETQGLLMMTLPYRFGLPGFAKPVMTQRIELNPEERAQSGRGHFRCDLFWPEHDLALEMKGMEAHTGRQNLDSDAIRELILGTRNITVVSATFETLASPAKFAALTKRISELTGKRLRLPDSYQQRQEESRMHILRGGCPWFPG